MFKQFGRFLMAPDGAASGGANSTPTPDQNSTPTPGGDGAKPDPKAEEAKFTQAQLDAIVQDRLAREREKQEKAAKKAQDDAEQERLKAQKEFEKLAEQRQTRVAELEAQLATAQATQERVKALEAALGTYCTAERAGLPAHLLVLLDAMPVEKQLEYIAANRAALKPVATQGATIPATPNPAGNAGKLTPEEKRKLAYFPRI